MNGCCVFCNNLVRGVSREPWDTILRDNGRFVIAPSKGSLVPGWLMVVSKRHALCSGAIPDNEFEDLRNSISMASEMVRNSFGPPTVFEHGPCVTGTPVGCGIDHQHVHVAPLPFSLKDAVFRLFPAIEWQLLGDLSETRDLYRSNTPYGLVQESNSEMFWCRPAKGVRQMFRRAIAATLGEHDRFDYGAFPHLLNALQTRDALQLPSS